MTQQQPANPLPYATPESGRAVRWHEFIGWKSLIGGYALVVATFIPMLLIVPRFEAVWRDFSVKLPLLTVVLLSFSRWLRFDHGWAYLLAMPPVLALIVGALSVPGRRLPAAQQARRVGLGLLLFIALGLAMLALVVIGLFLPMITMIDTVGGP